jgi:hypothetical protein
VQRADRAHYASLWGADNAGKNAQARLSGAVAARVRAASTAREKMQKKRLMHHMPPRLLKILMPFHNPCARAAPKGVELALSRYPQG